jgi:hypothetical protein
VTPDNPAKERLMRFAICAAAAIMMGGCAAIPVQQTTLTKPEGGSVTCKQVGRGVVSYSVGKSIYEDCIAKAKADGYN